MRSILITVLLLVCSTVVFADGDLVTRTSKASNTSMYIEVTKKKEVTLKEAKLQRAQIALNCLQQQKQFDAQVARCNAMVQDLDTSISDAENILNIQEEAVNAEINP